MRHSAIALMGACAAVALMASPAAAAMKSTVNTKHYDISGKSGGALLQAMDRRGPKHGFLTRAIAQTSYTVGWDIEWARKNRTCKVSKATATLATTYTYPNVTGPVSAEMKKRWARFIKGVRIHEERHGAIAMQMVKAADKAVAGFVVKNDPSCRKAQAAVKRRVDEVYAEYEARQVRFDDAEHRPGGAVDGLVKGLKH